jgi:hypothetical protein
MKTFLKTAIFVLLISISYRVSCQVLNIKTRVEKATLYLNGAFVTREAKIDVKAGKSTMKFTDIPSNADIKSIQISSDPNIRILSVKPYLTKKGPQRDINLKLIDLKDSIEFLKKEISKIEIQIKVISEEESILRKNQPSFTDSYAIKPQELKDVLDFNKFRLTEIYTNSQYLKSQQSEYTLKQKNMVNRLMALRQQQYNDQIEIEVEIDALQGGISRFEITYFTMFASWQPSYDVRVVDVSKPIEMTMKASMIQNTGEDWNNIKLSVSNGQPTGSENYPDIKPWYLNFHQLQLPKNPIRDFNPYIRQISGVISDSDGRELIGANVFFKEFPNVGTTTDLEGKYNLPIPLGAKTIIISYTGFETFESIIQNEVMNFELSQGQLLEEVVVLGSLAGSSPGVSVYPKDQVLKDYNTQPTNITYQPTTFSYEMKELFSLKNSVTRLQVDILTHQIPTLYDYYTIPKYEKSVFLNAGILDWQDYNLLDGKINLYLEGKYLGQSYINTKEANDTLQISLGRDQNIIVERTKIKEFSKKSYFSGTNTEIRAYAFTVKNNKNQTIRLKMQDNIPISTDKSIEVFDISHKDGIIDDESRIVTWQMELKPKTEKVKEIKYTVKYPSKRKVALD